MQNLDGTTVNTACMEGIIEFGAIFIWRHAQTKDGLKTVSGTSISPSLDTPKEEVAKIVDFLRKAADYLEERHHVQH